MQADALRDLLHDQIPLTAMMGIEVLDVSSEVVRLSAPLPPNVNHLGTVFGGSASVMAILAAWSLVQVHKTNRDAGGSVIIQRHDLEYLAPITGTFEATCTAPVERKWTSLWRGFDRLGKGRIDLTATLLCSDTIVGRFHGRYVVARNPRTQEGV